MSLTLFSTSEQGPQSLRRAFGALLEAGKHRRILPSLRSFSRSLNPRYLGLRADKPAGGVVRERPKGVK